MIVEQFDIAPLASPLAEGATILVPNQRIRDAILNSYAARQTRNSWRTPAVYAIDIWIKNQWRQLANQGTQPCAALRLLDSVEESLLWMAIVEQDRPALPLLNSDETAAAVQHAYQLVRLWLDEGQEPGYLPPGAGIPELTQFTRWARRFQQLCQQQGLCCLADATQTLVSGFSSGKFQVPEKTVLVNFYRPPPLYRRLFGLLSEDAQGELQFTVRDKSVDSRRRYEFPDFETEVRSCAVWAKQLCDSQPESHVGIIFNGNKSKLRQADRIFRDVFFPESTIDLSNDRRIFNGNALSRSLVDDGVVYDALLILEIGGDRLDSVDFCRLLQSPFLIGYREELEARIQLEIFIREYFSRRCSLSELMRVMSREEATYHCPLLLAALLQVRTLLRESGNHNSALQWSQVFAKQLEMLGWTGASADRGIVHLESLRLWQRLMKQFASTGSALQPLSRESALGRLKTLCRRTAIPNNHSQSSQLSLFSLDEAVGLEFTHTWFLGFDDQSQPSPPHPSPFLLHGLQRQAGIPGCTGALQLELARQAFDLVCRSTRKELHASYHRHDGDESFRPSSLISAFPLGAASVVSNSALNSLAVADQGRIKRELATDDRAPPLAADEELSGGQALISDQSCCPFRALARHRLQAKALEEFSDGLDARARGTALHKALETLFGELSERDQLKAMSHEEKLSLLTRASLQAIEELGRRFPEHMTPRFRLLEQQRLIQLLEKYLGHEIDREGFTVLHREEKLSWRERQLTINLKVDRIDRLNDGSLAIIDYKSGKSVSSPAQLLEERPENMQLPVYYCATVDSQDGTPGAVVIAQVNAERIRFSGVSAQGNFHPEVDALDDDAAWQDLTGKWQEKTRMLACEFIEGVARVDPANGSRTCAYCDLQPLCRIGELDHSRDYIDIQSDTEPSE